jgi:hypothetical protein
MPISSSLVEVVIVIVINDALGVDLDVGFQLSEGQSCGGLN